MKKILFLFLLFILTTSILITADFPVELEEYFSDPFVLVNSRHICIWDRVYRVIRVYDADNMKKIADLDRKGQGPGEWNFFSRITLKEDSLYLSSFPKLIHLTIDGKLIKETRCATNSGSFVPFGKNYIGRRYISKHPSSPTVKTQFSIYDSDLVEQKKIILTGINGFLGYKGRKKILKAYGGAIKARVYKDLFFVSNTSKGFHISVFDLDGKLLYEIKRDYKKRPVLESEIKEREADLRRGIGEKGWKHLKATVIYKYSDYYPPYENFAVHDDKILLFTYPKNGEIDLMVLDLKGNHLATKIFPEVKGRTCITSGRFALHKRFFYYIDEDLDEEVWKLHTINMALLKDRKK